MRARLKAIPDLLHPAVRRLILLACIVAAAPALAQPATGGAWTLTLLHTNDLHGHVHAWKGWEGELTGKTMGGLDHVAGAVKQVREAVGRDKVLLLDAGDTLGDSAEALHDQGASIVQIMNAIGYDAMVAGNHDPDFGADALRRRAAEARFDLLGANIVDRDGKPFLRPYVVKTVNGVKVGILGIAYPHTPLTTAARNVEGLRFRNAAETAREYVPRLRAEGARIVVVLSHSGLGADRALARAVPGIDVIVGGHSHNRMEMAIKEKETLIVQAGAFGSDLGRLDLRLDAKGIVEHDRTLIKLDSDLVPPDSDVAELMRTRFPSTPRTSLAEAMQPIVRAQTLAGQEQASRDAQSPADSLFADLLREATGAQIALLPGVGYGVALSGPGIGEDELRNLLPHDSKAVSLTVSGRQIREVLEQSLENVLAKDATQRVGGMVQVSGLRFRYDPARPRGDRVQEAHTEAGPLQPDADYRVVTNSLLAQGGHRYRSLAAARDRREHDSEFEIVRRAFREQRHIHPPTDVRITKGDWPTR